MADSRSSTWAYVGGVVAAAVIGGTVGCWIGDLTFGDEPPIRVKNGSMEFQLASGKWEQEPCAGNPGRSCAWRPSEGESKGTFTVVVQSTTACAVPAGATIDRVAVIYSDRKRFMVRPGKSQGSGRLTTMVNPHALLKPDPQKPAVLRYDAEGFVERIDFDGDDAQGNPASWSCTFTNAQDLVEACISSSAKKDGCGP